MATKAKAHALSRTKAPPSRLVQRRTLVGYIFIAPFILGFILWFLIPAGVAANLTFQKWNLISPARYVGFENIERLF